MRESPREWNARILEEWRRLCEQGFKMAAAGRLPEWRKQERELLARLDWDDPTLACRRKKCKRGHCCRMPDPWQCAPKRKKN